MADHLLKNIPYSVLDLATVLDGFTAADTFKTSLDLAKQSETLGYTRYWFAEHHNMAGVASSAPAVLIGYIAGNTTSIRVGSGGIMLPNHAPLIVAEQFGTNLEYWMIGDTMSDSMRDCQGLIKTCTFEYGWPPLVREARRFGGVLAPKELQGPKAAQFIVEEILRR